MTDQEPVDIAAVIDAAPFSALLLWVTLLSYLIMIIDGFDLQAMALAAPAVAASWNLKRELLGPVLAASLVGMGLGSVALGWFGDRRGRKTSFCVCIAILSLGSLMCGCATSLSQLVLFRFITGVGLGGAAPLATSLVAEWMPRRWRSVAVAVVIAAIPLGGMLGAALSQRIIPAYGWRSVFLLGGVFPLALLAVAIVQLPESPRYLAGRTDKRAALARCLNRLGDGQRFTSADRFFVAERELPAADGLKSLVSAPYLRTTLLLWLAFACNTLALYGFVNWLPIVLSSAGQSLSSALHGSFLFNCGGIVGAIVGSVLISFFGSRRVGTSFAFIGSVAALFIGLSMAAVGHGGGMGARLFPLVAVAGVCLNGMQVFLYPVAAHSYPTIIRASGVGCASGVARIGGVLSSVVGSAVFALGLSVGDFFFILAAIILVTAVSFFALRSHIPGRNSDPSRAATPGRGRWTRLHSLARRGAGR
jgi:AAHS family 4-hydroxybenzoate transporter-like MFS transporter